jgi:hypothetical protein
VVVRCASMLRVCGPVASAEVGASAEDGVSMSAATILAGILREVQPHAIILAAGTRIALPPDLSAKDVPEPRTFPKGRACW